MGVSAKDLPNFITIHESFVQLLIPQIEKLTSKVSNIYIFLVIHDSYYKHIHHTCSVDIYVIYFVYQGTLITTTCTQTTNPSQHSKCLGCFKELLVFLKFCLHLGVLFLKSTRKSFLFTANIYFPPKILCSEMQK